MYPVHFKLGAVAADERRRLPPPGYQVPGYELAPGILGRPTDAAPLLQSRIVTGARHGGKSSKVGALCHRMAKLCPEGSQEHVFKHALPALPGLTSGLPVCLRTNRNVFVMRFLHNLCLLPKRRGTGQHGDQLTRRSATIVSARGLPSELEYGYRPGGL